MATYTNPYTVTAWNATYSTALAAVSNGQYFGVPSSSGETADIYLRNGSGQGVFQDTIPYAGGVQAGQDAIETARVNAGTIAGYLVDVAAVDAYYNPLKIKNRNVGTPDKNLLGSSRPGVLIASNLLVASGATLASATGSDGGANKAARISSASGSGKTCSMTIWVPPGLWMFAFDAYGNNGTDDSVRFGFSSITKSITHGSWNSYTAQMTHSTAGALQTVYFARDNAAGFDITIDNVRLIPGSAAGSASAEDATPFAKTTAVNRVANVFENAAATKSNFYIPLSADDSTTRTAMSGVIAVKKTGSDSALEPLLCEVETTSELAAATAGLWFGINGTKRFYAGGKNSAVSVNMVKVASSDNYDIVGFKAGPNGTKLFFDNIVLDVTTAAWTGFTARCLEVLNFRNDTTKAFNGRFSSLTLDNTELSDAAMQAIIAATKTRLTAMGLTVQTFGSLYIAEGDSITAGSGASDATNGYAKLLGTNYTPYLQGIDYGVPNSNLYGNVTASLNLNDTTRQATLITKIQEVVATGRRPIVSVFIGANDGNSFLTTPTTYYNALKAYWAAIRAAGAKLVVCTVIPNNLWAAPTETARLALNAQIRADTTLWDALADFALNANFLAYSGTYYADTTHPNDTGHASLATTLKSAVDTVWTATPASASTSYGRARRIGNMLISDAGVVYPIHGGMVVENGVPSTFIVGNQLIGTDGTHKGFLN